MQRRHFGKWTEECPVRTLLHVLRSQSGPIRSYPHVGFDGGSRRESGLVVLTLSSSARDPERTITQPTAAKHKGRERGDKLYDG